MHTSVTGLKHEVFFHSLSLCFELFASMIFYIMNLQPPLLLQSDSKESFALKILKRRSGFITVITCCEN